jgi:DNA-binding MarR family transcriptional regulator
MEPAPGDRHGALLVGFDRIPPFRCEGSGNDPRHPITWDPGGVPAKSSEVDMSDIPDGEQPQSEPEGQEPGRSVVAAIAQASTQLLPRIDAELRDRHGLSLPAFAVLHLLAQRSGERLTMTDLAKVAGMSPAGVTRVMQRLAADGLVVRQRDPADRRPLFASLTEAGEVRLRAAGPTYAQAVHTHLTDFARPGELEALGGVLRRALDAQGSVPSLE